MRQIVLLSAVISLLTGSAAQLALETRPASSRCWSSLRRLRSSMRRSRSITRGTQISAMKDHCEKLAKLSDDEAKEYDAMASMHRDMAK